MLELLEPDKLDVLGLLAGVLLDLESLDADDDVEPASLPKLEEDEEDDDAGTFSGLRESVR